jgi:DNA-binding transcriptional regulator YiaG
MRWANDRRSHQLSEWPLGLFLSVFGISFTRRIPASFQLVSSAHFHDRVAFLLAGTPVHLRATKPFKAEVRTLLANALRRKRSELGLTQAQVALMLQVSPWSVLNWEANGEPAIRHWPGIIALLDHDPLPVVDFAGALAAARRRGGLSISEAAKGLGIDQKPRDCGSAVSDVQVPGCRPGPAQPLP